MEWTLLQVKEWTVIQLLHFSFEVFSLDRKGPGYSWYDGRNYLSSFLVAMINSFLQGSFNSTGLVVSSKFPRFSNLYTLTIVSADPKSISANKPVELTKSVTKWSGSPPHCYCYSYSPRKDHIRIYTLAFPVKYLYPCCCRFTKDGVLVEGLFWKDVEGLINEYNKEPKKSKWVKLMRHLTHPG